MKIKEKDVLILTGYGKDNLARLLQVEDVGKDYIVGKCLLRSTLTQPVYRTYKLSKAKGISKTILEKV